jgi:hypothetical protein
VVRDRNDDTAIIADANRGGRIAWREGLDGVTDRHNNQGELFDAEFQPLRLVGRPVWPRLHAALGQWSFDAMLVTNGTQDTDLGDRVLYNAAISDRLMGGATGVAPMKLGAALPDPMWHGGPGHTHSQHEVPAQGPAFDLVLELNGQWHAKEVQAGVTDPNSGGTTLYLAPGLRSRRTGRASCPWAFPSSTTSTASNLSRTSAS